MYRGSSFLLQKDYRVHVDVVKEICKGQYDPLWNLSVTKIAEPQIRCLIFQISQKLEDIYIDHRRNVDERKEVSDTLLTKILLGTFGCVPAYDTYFVRGVKLHGVASGTFSEKSLTDLADFYISHFDGFERVRSEMLAKGTDCPQMKLLDLCFWKIGFDSS